MRENGNTKARSKPWYGYACRKMLKRCFGREKVEGNPNFSAADQNKSTFCTHTHSRRHAPDEDKTLNEVGFLVLEIIVGRFYFFFLHNSVDFRVGLLEPPKVFELERQGGRGRAGEGEGNYYWQCRENVKSRRTR